MWTRIEPIDERSGDARSERSERSEQDEHGVGRRMSDEEIGVAVSRDGASQEGIWQTTTITREVEERDRKGRSWLD